MKIRSALASAAVAAVTVMAAGVLTFSGGLTAAGAGTLAASAGCGKAPTLASGTRPIQSGGQNRSYILRIPDNYDSNHAYRLIFSFHWWGGTAEQVDNGSTSGPQWSYYRLRPLANNTTIFVAPQGIGNAWANSGGQDVTRVWNGALTTSGSTATVRNASHNGSVPASGSTTFGFLANGAPSTPTLTCASA